MKIFFSGLNKDPNKPLEKIFYEDYHSLVMIKDIEFISFCEHHLLPFTGKVHIAYYPNGKIVGLSKFGRLVDVFAKRPQVQEKLTQNILTTIQENLNTKGVAVMVQANHSCMNHRGVHKANASMITESFSGIFETDNSTRNNFYQLINQ